MIKLIRLLLGLCIHDWKDHAEIRVSSAYSCGGKLYMRQRCAKCNNYRRIEY